jgi:hypothetical protein
MLARRQAFDSFSQSRPTDPMAAGLASLLCSTPCQAFRVSGQFLPSSLDDGYHRCVCLEGRPVLQATS